MSFKGSSLCGLFVLDNEGEEEQGGIAPQEMQYLKELATESREVQALTGKFNLREIEGKEEAPPEDIWVRRITATVNIRIDLEFTISENTDETADIKKLQAVGARHPGNIHSRKFTSPRPPGNGRI